jgi:hypothetical protein
MTKRKTYGRPFEKGNPGRPLFWTTERVLPALLAARGNNSKAAAILTAQTGIVCHRETVRRLVRKVPSLRQVIEAHWTATNDEIARRPLAQLMASPAKLAESIASESFENSE